MIVNRKSALLTSASRPVVEQMERRQLLSATLGVSSSLMVFNAVKNSTSVTETVTLTDTGDAALTLGAGSFALANDPNSSTQDSSLFTVVNASAAPATLAPGGSFALEVNYASNAVVTNKAFLEISTNDPVNPTQEVSLHGIGTKGLGGSNQPSLATILQAYNIPTYVGEGFNDANAASDSVYPNPPDSSSQEVVMQRFTKAGSGPITIQVLASFTASGFAKSYTLGTYTPGQPTTLKELFYTTASENQTTYIHPQGSTSFDPGTTPFGFYFVSNVQVQGRVGYSEDALNTWDTTNNRKIRFFPYETSNGTVIPNKFVMTSTEWNGPSGYDFTNIVAIVSNLAAAPSAPSAPVLGLQNLSALPGSNTLVFNRIQGTATIGDIVHDTNSLQINNTGQSPLIINSYTLSANWVLVSPPTFPATIAAGKTLDLSIKFTAQSKPTTPYNETNSNINGGGGGVWNGTLVLNSNDPTTPTATVQLRGWWQQHSENDNEPGIQTIVNLLEGWDTFLIPSPTAPDLTESSSTSGSSPTYYGEEVVSPYWQEADASQSVSVTQIASYHTEGNTAKTSWYAQGSSGSLKTLFTTAADAGQTLYPYAQNTTTTATASFSTSNSFGFNVDGLSTQDSLNTGSSGQGGGHHFRFYPIRNSAGFLIPNAYIMAFDYATSSENYDFQDTLYVVTNIHPVVTVANVGSTENSGGPAAPTDAVALSNNGVNTFTWAPTLASNIVGYNIFRSTSSASGGYAQINTSLVTGTSYTDTTSPATGTTYYKVQAIDSNGLHSLGEIASVGNTGTQTTGSGAPVAATENVSTQAATAVPINVVADATDNANGTVVASSVLISTMPGSGQASVDPTTGVITYTPTAGFTGTDTFQYTISDTTGAVSAPALVTVTVTAAPVGAPVAANLSYSVQQNSSLTFNVSTGATDNSNATIAPNTVVITQAPAHGTASVDPQSGVIVYTPTQGYVGSDSLLYTISDSLGTVSPVATVTLAVTSTGVTSAPVAGAIAVSASTAGDSAAINVLQFVSDTNGTVNPASVKITTVPSHGTASVDSSGVVHYLATTGYIGSDSLQYTVADTHGLVSAAATISVNVGVTINNSTAKSLTFVDASGSKLTIAITGGGTAQLSFNGTGTAQTIAGPHGTGSVLVTGTGLEISGIAVTGTTINSTLTISRRGTSATTVGGISVAGAIGRIVAPTTVLTGALSISGALSSIQTAGVSGSTITIGSAEARAGGVTLNLGIVTDSTLSSALPIRSLKATEWVTNATAGAISAPSISSLVTASDFEAAITTTGGKPFSLGTVHIGGQAGGESWNVSGATATSSWVQSPWASTQPTRPH